MVGREEDHEDRQIKRRWKGIREKGVKNKIS
jgi:hypothetical protein